MYLRRSEKRNDGSVLCVNGTPIRYKIGDGTIRIRYSVNVALMVERAESRVPRPAEA